jgi:S-adenosylmethionine decarboxylase
MQYRRPPMRDIAPDIFRQRFIIEGYYAIEVTKDKLKQYLLDIARHLDLRTYGDPIIFAPAEGMGKAENAGFDAFVPLIDSGISAYIWSKATFFSIVIYTCKGFDEKAALAFTKDFFSVSGECVSASF